MNKKVLNKIIRLNHKLHNVLLNPLSVLFIIIFYVWKMDKSIIRFSHSEVLLHIIFLIISLSLYSYSLASRDFIRDILILKSKKDFILTKFHENYFEFYRENKRENVLKTNSVYIWTLLLFYSMLFLQNYNSDKIIFPFGQVVFGFPICITLLLSIYVDKLHEFFYFSNVYNTDLFLKSNKIYTGDFGSPKNLETDEVFEKRLIEDYSYASNGYLKYYYQKYPFGLGIVFFGFERFKFWLAIALYWFFFLT
jgi:hypothetical protein